MPQKLQESKFDIRIERIIKMSITGIISAIGNNNSIYPLLFRDCVIEVPSKIYIARKENLKESKVKANDATREKFIDEYATSAVWLGGIPLVEKLSDKFISKKGFNSSINMKLLKEEEFQGIKYNINKFKNLAPDAVKDLEKALNNPIKFEKLIAAKFIAATTIPICLMGFVLPKLNFALTSSIKNKRTQKKNISGVNPAPSILSFSSGRKQEISFGSNTISYIANLRTVDKMAITDGGLTVGRITTSRNKDEAYVNAFRMLGSMFLNFVAPKYIAKFLDKGANKLFNINVNLDPLIMGNKEFIEAIKNKRIELPKSNSAKDLFEFIDNNSQSIFCKFAQQNGIITYLKNGVRDPRKYVDIASLKKFKDEFETFVRVATNSKNIEKFAQKAKFVKCTNILANVGISSFLLAVALPKAQYIFNKLVTGSYSDPGLRDK